MKTRYLCLAAWVWLVAGSCGDNYVNPDGGADAGISTTRPVFDPPGVLVPPAWDSMPFPSDLFLDENGFMNLAELPVGPGADISFSDLMMDRVRELRGAGVWTDVFFPMSGNLDAATLDGNVKLVDLDDNLAEVPLDLVWRADLHTLVAAVRMGTMLRQDRHYAAYVTNGVRGVDGRRLGPPASFAEAINLAAVPSDPALARAQNVLRPLIEALPADTVGNLVTATVFTTENITGVTKAMRDIAAANVPAVSNLDVHTDLDTLYGIAAPDTPPGVGAMSGRPQPHSHIAALIHGDIALPSFVSAQAGVAGLVELDGNGDPIVKGTERVRFTLVLPVAGSYANLPVMIYLHPFTRTRADILSQSDIAASRGIATLGIDIMYHGDRYPNPSDVINEITGTAIPDGFGDSNFLSASRFLHLQSSGGIPIKHTGVIRDNVRQSVVDISSLCSFVTSGNVTPIRNALSSAGLPSDLSFFNGGIALTGDSLGAMLADIVASVEPRIKIAWIDVSPAGLPFPTFLHSPAFSDLVVSAFVTPLDIGDRVTLGDPVADVRFDPMVVLLNYVIETGDPAAWAPYLLSGEVRGDTGPHYALNEAWSDEWVPNISTEHLAGAIGLSHLRLNLATPPPDPWLRYVTLPEIASPVMGNANNGHTAAFILWHPASHGLTYWYEDILQMEPGFPPFVFLANPVLMNNPTVEAQSMRADFFADYFAARTPVLTDPF